MLLFFFKMSLLKLIINSLEVTKSIAFTNVKTIIILTFPPKIEIFQAQRSNCLHSFAVSTATNKLHFIDSR